MKIAVSGYEGRLGSELIKNGCIKFISDVTDVFGISEEIERTRPDVIINCAALTHVDECETDEGYKQAIQVNYRGATNIRSAFDGYLIHISTDYVFDCKDGPYSEDFLELHPVNGYGFTKFGAEAGLSFFDTRTTIVRTTGLYGGCSGLPDFAYTVIKALTRKEEIKVTNELYGNQTYIPHLVESILKLSRFTADEPQIIHLASKEVVTRYSFALMIADVFGLDKTLITPCKNKEVPGWVAERPTKGGLKTDFAVRYGFPIYSIYNGLRDLKENGLKYYEIRNNHPIL